MALETKYTDQLILEKLDRIANLLEIIVSRPAQTIDPSKRTAERSNDLPPSMYVTEKEAAQITGLSTAWFSRARWAGNGPPYVKLGGTHGRVQYNREELLKWFEAHKVRSTSEYSGG